MGTHEGRTSSISVCPAPSMERGTVGTLATPPLSKRRNRQTPAGWGGAAKGTLLHMLLFEPPEWGILAGTWEAPGSKAQARMRGLILGQVPSLLPTGRPLE